MPICYHFEFNRNLLVYTATGLCTGREFFLAERQSFQDEHRHPDMKIIVDIRFAELDLDLNDIRDLVDLNKRLTKQGFEPEMTVFLTRSSRFGNIGEIFQTLAEGVPIKLRVFHNLRDTVKWLGLSDAEEEICQFVEKAREKG